MFSPPASSSSHFLLDSFLALLNCCPFLIPALCLFFLFLPQLVIPAVVILVFCAILLLFLLQLRILHLIPEFNLLLILLLIYPPPVFPQPFLFLLKALF